MGVLRSGVENVDWTDRGDEPDWLSARACALASLRMLAVGEGRQEYGVRVGDVDAIVHPRIDVDGRLDLSNLDGALPVTR